VARRGGVTARGRIAAVIAGVLVLAGGAAFTALGPGMADRRMNVRLEAPPYPVSAAAESLHRTLAVADLHADALLWGRDLLARADHGHVDLPRLQDGRIALQVFAAVTKTPRGINYERNDASTDNITLLAVAQRWPMRAWTSLLARARHQARRLHDAAARSDGNLVVVRTRAELAQVRERQQRGEPVVAALLATEGLHPLEGRLEALDTLFADGYRMVGLTHFFDNEVAGSAHGVDRGGLTPLGRAVVARAAALGMLVDVAHASPATIDDVLGMTTRPVVVSHTGVQATCPGPRNLTDDQLRRIAATGGVIGIGFWDGAVCDPSPASIARAIAHAVQVAGPAHVALGSDWDGATTTSFDASGTARVTEALLAAGLSPEVIRQVMGENALRLLAGTLP
jgi:microsomal dipeptidase-like Zn-dependent dipeptidase